LRQFEWSPVGSLESESSAWGGRLAAVAAVVVAIVLAK
jgi:hypothetical protein